MALPRELKNFNLFIDGVGHAGRVPELKLPKLARKMEEFRAGGMDGPVELDRGMEVMAGEFTVAEYSEAVLKQHGVTEINGVKLRFRGAAHSDQTGATDTHEVVMHGRYKEIDLEAAKPGEGGPMKIAYTLSYFKWTINGEEAYEIDQTGMVYRVFGEDRLAQQREALAL